MRAAREQAEYRRAGLLRGLARRRVRPAPAVRRAVVALGAFGWDATLGAVRRSGGTVPTPKPKFGHGRIAVLHTADGKPLNVIGCYHPSQQNTFTGRLTEQMIDDVLSRGQELAGLGWACGGSGR